MKAVLLLSLALCGGAAQAADIVLKDDTGATLRLPAPARRIVSLAPHVTENLFAAGAGGQVVGTVDYSDYPEAAKKIARVGGYSRLDLEAVAALRPDLIIAWESGNAPGHVAKLRSLGIPVFISQPNRIEDVAELLEKFGQLAGTSAVANGAAARFRARLAEIRKQYSGQPRVPTFYQIWKQPLMSVGRQQIISDVISLCGGSNVFGQVEQMAPKVSEEAVLAANPEAIVASGMGDSRPEWLDDWKRWKQITAVARDNLFFVPPELIQRHTPRILEGAARLCEHLETARHRRPAR
ncbi:ABC-type Fe3+-hydroxamate transport system, periplasmic component [Azospira oryzae PS]|uniref:ABC-type Fe3+-hydroxamate transport system, periplasmic component n=1 Tax=Azospira oryzae (strain ATCC BAA-33 / DSM 13638 / PS) TaxID=640081 RepID=G8QFE2_AZOOP|nr:cobalamin-binding protein [Azospira oryzae]AEV24952.1 ABC-type Fe3+-hydroxamate transport system, periplasmic component [Azospira oryzae PS]